MPRLRVIVLEQSDARSIRYALWADVPVALQPRYADPTLESAWTDALAADLAALRAGQVTETVQSVTFDADVPLASARAELEARWAAYQTHVTARNPFRRYGMTWDGLTWVVP